MTTELSAALRLKLVDEVSQAAERVIASFEGMGEAATSGADQSAAASARAEQVTRSSASAIEDLRLKQLAASSAARTHASTLRRLQASGEATDAQLAETSLALVRAREETARLGREARELTLAERRSAAARRATATAAKQEAQAEKAAAAAAEQHAAALKQESAATGASAGGMKAAGDATRAKSRATAENINLVSELALGLGALDPRLQQVGIAFAGAGNNAFQLANFLGPVPLVITTIATVIPSLVAGLSDTSEEMDGVARSTQTATERLRELRDQERQRREEREEDQRLERGEASAAQLEDQRSALETQLSDVQQQRRDLLRSLPSDVRDAAREGGDPRAAVREGIRHRLEASVGGNADRATLQQIATLRAAQAQLARQAEQERTLTSQRATTISNITIATARESVQHELDRARQAQEEVSSTGENLSSLLTIRGSSLTERQRERIQALQGAATAGQLDTTRNQRELARVDDDRIERLLRELQTKAVAAAEARIGLNSAEAEYREAQRVQVDVRVHDDRVEAVHVDSGASDFTGGQQ